MDEKEHAVVRLEAIITRGYSNQERSFTPSALAIELSLHCRYK